MRIVEKKFHIQSRTFKFQPKFIIHYHNCFWFFVESILLLIHKSWFWHYCWLKLCFNIQRRIVICLVSGAFLNVILVIQIWRIDLHFSLEISISMFCSINKALKFKSHSVILDGKRKIMSLFCNFVLLKIDGIIE